MSSGGTAMLLFSIFTSVLTTDTSALSCDWSGGFGKLDGFIPGALSNVSITNGAGECRDRCMNQTGFICAAVNYKVSEGACELLAENDQTASVIEPFDGSWLYFIRPLCAGIWLPWTAEKGKYIASGNSSDSTTNNLQDCMTSCMRDTSGDACRALNIETLSSANPDYNNCKLQSERAGDESVSVSDNPSWQYFNRPPWYLESSTTSTLADIRYQGIIRTYLNIYIELTIPFSGYLVAWQYYMQTDRPCPTYASIWRPDGEDNYTLISNTLLAPEDPHMEGVRFQYIQNEIIRIQQHDVLSVYVEFNRDTCNNNMVSVNGREGKERIVIYNDMKLDINTTRSRITNDKLVTYNLVATPALRAYVSAYLSLDDSPMTYHNISLSPGQIWMKSPPPLTTEESVVVAGYKIICSTDANLSSLVSCYDGLVPVNSRDVLLNLPDVTITYHVSVQIARNFNGMELLDDRYSSVSSVFCTERSKTDQVNISESDITTEDSKATVTVIFQHAFHTNDMCAKKIKLNYSGYDSEYRTLDNNRQREYILQLEQGITYELAIYLKLADGAEIVFWTQEHTSSSVASTSTSSTENGFWTREYTTAAGTTISETSIKSYFKEHKTSRAAAIGVGVFAVLGIGCSLAFTIHCIIRKRRSAGDAVTSERVTEMQMKRLGNRATKNKRMNEFADAEAPSEYEVVCSPPAAISNEYESPDQQHEEKSGEYEVVGASNTHVYEELNLK